MTVRKRHATPKAPRPGAGPASAAATTDLPATMLIEIDPALSGGFIHGRFDLVIRGRIGAATPIEDVSLLVGDTLVSRIQFGEPQRAAPVTLPDGTPGRQRAFQFSVPMLEDAAPGPCHCVIMARAADNQACSEAFDLSVEPGDESPVILLRGPAQSTDTYGDVRPPIVLYVERAAIDGDGLLVLHGWAVAATRVITVQAFIDDTRIAAAKTGIERDDVGTIYPDYPNNRLSGFSVQMTLAEDLRNADTLRVQVICLSGFSAEIVVPVERLRPPTALQLSKNHSSSGRPFWDRLSSDRPGSGQRESDESESGGPESGRPGANRSEPNQPNSDQPASDQPEAGKTAVGRSRSGRTRSRLPRSGQPQADRTQTDRPQSDGTRSHLPPSGKSQAAQSPSDLPPSGQTPFGQTPFGQAPFGHAPPGQPSPAHAFSMAASQQAYQLSAGFLLAENAMPTLVAAVLPSPPAPPADPRREINCFCDGASVAHDRMLTVVGWAVCAVGIGAIHIYLDDQLLGEAETGFPRPDVGEEFNTIAMARLAGYRFEQPVPDLAAGEHRVRVVVHNGLDDTRDAVLAVHISDLAPPAAARHMPPPSSASDMPEFRFELDSPLVTEGGVVADPITGRLTVEGWVLARSGIAGMEVLLDDQRLGEAHYGLARQDVGAAFPDWHNALRSGYAFHCPPRVLRDGAHTVQLTVRANNGQEHVVRFAIEVHKTEDQDELANIRRRVARVEIDLVDSLLARLECRPDFHLVLRQVGKLAPARLTATLDSLRGQTYRDWRLTIMADAADASLVRGLVAGWDEELTARITVIGADEPAWDAPLAAVAETRTLCGLLCPGDELGVDALAEIALAAGLHPSAEVIYGDEVRISPASHEREPFFKPDWSPDLLLSTNYIGRPWFADAALVRGLGTTPDSLARDGEYDFVLRATEQAAAIRHVPKLLAQRGATALDSDAAEAAALARATTRRDTPAEILPGWGPGTWRAKRAVTVAGKVSIIVPTCAAKGYIETCLDTLRTRTAYRNIEIVAIDNIPDSEMGWKAWLQQNADLVIDIPDAFNWSHFNNTAVAACDGEFLLFLNDDIEVIQDDWLDTMLEHMARPEVAIVGPQLLYPDRKVQHAGMFLANNGVGRHAFRFAAADEPGYFGLALTQRNVIAVTGACMLVRRDVFERLGRFDELHTIVNNDLDFCLRAHQAGLLTVFTPYATLLHHELASRDKLKDAFDLTHFDAHWKTMFAAGDPYFSPRLSRHSDDYRPDDEPLQTVFSGHPLFRPHDVQRILVVKLDHIGDFVTALPAIRRLKQIFPHAELTVLAGRASEAFVTLEPAIDALIPFDFFHARSQLGERDLTREDFVALQAQLAPYRFDLAVDLRKHLSTRDVLKYTGARFLAGFDYMGQFPFLDIALEWDGDKTLQRKRGHVVDDLLALVEAVATATSSDRTLIQPVPPRAGVDELPEAIRPLFARPVVAVHAGAGNVTKQWPEAHFTALIDLLVERNGVNVMLVGGPDDEAVSNAIMANVLRPDAVASMAGQTRLAALPQLLSACVMYIGNDSGPKHIAAAMGMPTVGIHSGVVDATEWGPMGERSVALRRNMTCSPCYLANAADCPRNLACLRLLEPALVHHAAQALLARPLGASANPTDAMLRMMAASPGDPASVTTAALAASDDAPATPDTEPPARSQRRTSKARTAKPTARPRRGAPNARVPA